MRFKYITDHSDTRVLDEYYKCHDRVMIITGPLGSGKTYASCEKIFYFMCNQAPDSQRIRHSRFYAIRNTYPDLLGTTVKDWMELFGELGHFKGGGIEPPTHKLLFKLQDKTIVKSEFIFLALDRPQAVKKLRGAQATGFWLNEIKELPKPVLDMCDLRHGRFPSPLHGGCTWHGVIGDTNQVDDDHYLYTLAEETKPKGWRFFVQPGAVSKDSQGRWQVNPKAENIENLPEDYYGAGIEGKDDDWVNVNIANNYGTISDGKPIYKEQWRDHLHVNPKIMYMPDEPVFAGLDFGLTPSAVFGQISPKGKINIFAELVSENTGINQFYNFVIKPFLKKRITPASQITWIGDPAGNKRSETDEQTVFKELQDLGIDVIPANTNNATMRIEAVRFYLELMSGGEPAFQLHPDCKVLRKGFNGGYRYRRIQVVGDERFMSVPDKNKFSHPHDALQYLMLHIKGDTVSTKPFKRQREASRWLQ